MRKTRVYQFLPLILGVCIAYALLAAQAIGGLVNYDEVGLGEGTESRFAQVDGRPIHCQDFTPGHFANADACFSAAESRPGGTSVLWLGNSQLHGLNQTRGSETTAVPIIDRWVRAHGAASITLSQPNANFQEHYAMFEIARASLPLKLLILPAVFDDTREDGVRESVLSGLSRSAARDALSGTAAGRRMVAQYRPAAPAGNSGTQDGDLAALDHTVQERTERWFNDRLDEAAPLWANRPNARGEIFATLFKARNTALGIDPTTKRPVIPSRYQANMDALQDLLQSAAAHGVRVLVYIAPIRDDVEIPYVADEYARFKADVERLAGASSGAFANLEGIVPGPLWGTKEATRLGGAPEYDFMHFQAGGHRLLADSLTAALDRDHLLGPPTP